MKSLWAGARLLIGALAALLIVLGVENARGQANEEILNTLDTTAGEALVTQVRSVTVEPTASSLFLQLRFGFGTDEAFGPGTIFDAFSITVQSADLTKTWVLATFDASGVVWAPITPGTDTIDDSTISRTAVNAPNLIPNFNFAQAYAVEWTLPSAAIGQPLNIYYDLYNNQNPIASQGWFTDVIVVPEPGVVSLGVLGLGLVWLIQRRTRSRSGRGSRWVAVALIACGLGAVSARAQEEQTFTLGGVEVTLVDVTPNAAVYFKSMRLNRALNVWNLELLVSNRSAITIEGPVVVLVDSFTGTTGLQGADGVAGGGKSFVDLSGQISGRNLSPGETTSTRTLTLGRSGTASPVLNTRVFAAKPPELTPLGLTRTLNEAGQPLPSVALKISGPGGLKDQLSDRDSGVSSFGQTSGAHTVLFSRDGYLPVWRQQLLSSNEPAVLPNPRLAKRGPAVNATPLGGAVLSNTTGSIQIEVPAGALIQATTLTLTPLTGQSLPAFLPLGWSPLSAFWIESAAALQSGLPARLRPAGSIARTESAAVVRWNETTLTWDVTQLVQGNGTNAVSITIPSPGAYALVVADVGATTPPSAQAGEVLRGVAVPAIDAAALTASGTVTPSVSPASVDPAMVTGLAQLEVRHASQALPSGYLLRGEVTETYQLSDGSLRLSPAYEHFIVAYQRPGDQDATTLHASFPMRPLLLFGPEQLQTATIKVDVLPQAPFDGEVLDADGGQIGDNGVRVLAGTGRLAGPSAVRLRRLDGSIFTNIVGGGASIVAAFDLTIDRSTVINSLSAQLSGAPTNGLFVLGRVLSEPGFYGLQPIERLRSDALGNLSSLEPATGERLPGLGGSGQFVLVQVGELQTLVEGVARNGAGNVQSNMPVSIVGLPWLTLSGGDGKFQLVGPAGERQISIRDPLTGDTGFVGVTVGNPTTPVTQDLSTSPRGPRVAKISPADNATRVPRVGSVVIEFNEAVNPASIVNAIQLLLPDNSVVSAAVTLNLANRIATLNPANELAANTTYRLRLADTIRDPSGLAIEGDREFTFTTVPSATRVNTAQLVIYEPGATNVPAEILNGIPAYEPGSDPFAVVVHGQPGVADPGVAVILANESSGETTTVLSRVDGSFDSVISGTEEDFISATFVNLNGTRVYVPVSRQEFDNGFVGLYPQGGILEAQSDGGPVKVIIEPGAIPNRTKLRMKVPSAAELAALLGDTKPDVAAALAKPMILEGDGQPMSGPIKVSFVVNLASIGYTNDDPREAAIALVRVTDTDGVKAFEVMDQLKFEPNNGGIRAAAAGVDEIFYGTVNSVIGLAPQADVANNVFRYVLMPILVGGRPIVVKGRVIQSFDMVQLDNPFAVNDPLLQGFNFAQLGKAFGVLDLASQGIGAVNNANTYLTDLLEGRPLGGALVTLQNIFTPNIRGRIRPGMVYSTSGRDGTYLMVAPTTPWIEVQPGDFFLVRATHPRFQEEQTEQLFALSDMSIAGVAFKNFVFRQPIPLQVPPEVNVAHAPPYPAAGESVQVQINAAQGFQGHPEVNVFVEQVFPTNQVTSDVRLRDVAVTNYANRTRWSGKVTATNTISHVILRISAIPSGGQPRVLRHRISFVGEPILSNDGHIPDSDPTDKKGPVVVASAPVEGGLVPDSGEIVLYFNEPIDRVAETNVAGFVLSPPSPGVIPAVRLDASQTELRVSFAGLLPDTDYVLSVSGESVVDLLGNALDQRPSTTEAETFTLSFRTPPIARYALPGLINGAGSVIHGALLYAIDNTTPPMLRTYNIGNPSAPKLVSSMPVVGTPRDLVVIPRYSYRLNLHDPTRTNDLVAVVGGNLDAILEDLDGDRRGDNVLVKGQYLRVFEMADPAKPVEIASPILSYRVGAAVTKVRWHPPNLVYQEFGADLHQLVFVNLQEHLIGRHARAGEANAFPAGGKEGVDNNDDGDYADPGESFPLPERVPTEFHGKKQSYVIDGSTQRMLDFSVAGNTVGVTLTGGYALTRGGLPDTGRPVFPQYRTLAFGGVEIAAGSVDFASGDYPGRVTLVDGLPIEADGRLYTPIVALVSLSPDRLGRHRLVALDISLPESPKLIGDLSFPADLVGGNIRSVEYRGGDILEMTSVSHVFQLSSRLLGRPNPPEGQLHPAVVGFFPNAGGRMRSLGTSDYGVRSAAEGARNELVQTAPRLSFVTFPTTTEIVDPRYLPRDMDGVAAAMVSAERADYLVPARVRADHLGHNSDLFPASPRVHYYVLVEAPGGAGEKINLGVESLSPAGWPLPNKGAGFPPVRAVEERTLTALNIKLRPDCDAPIRPMTAYRLSDNPASPYYNRYLSRPFVVVYESMSFDDLATHKILADREILWSGASIRAFVEPTEQLNSAIGPFAGRVDVPRGVIFPASTAVASTLDVSYIMGPNPPPPGGDEALDGTYGSVRAHNGEFRTEATDFTLPSPRMPIEIERTIGGQDNYDGPFGLGWDFNYNQRITELQPQLFPAGFKMPLIPRGTLEDSVVGSSKDVLFHTGAGRIVLFQWRGIEIPTEFSEDPLVKDLNYEEIVADYFLPEPGVFDLLVKFKDGKYERLTPDGMRFKYAANGRLESIIDRFPLNRHQLEYDRHGWLRRIDDRSVTTDRFLEFGYYRRASDPDFLAGLDERSDNTFQIGKICRLRDYAERDVLYFYSDEGLLIRREGIEVAGENGGFVGRNQTHYLYEKCRIVGVAVGQNKTPLVASETEPGTHGVPVAKGSSGTGLNTRVEVPAENAAHKLDNQKTTTEQADGRVTEITVDKLGHPKVTTISGPGIEPAKLEQEYDANGLVTVTKYPEGRIHRLTYDTNNVVFRSRGNLLSMSVEPGLRGGEGYTETYSYDPFYNLPSGAHTDANGFTTTYTLSADRRFVRSIQHDSAGTETFDYNDRGQMTAHTDYDGIEMSSSFDAATGFVRTTRKGPHSTSYTYGGGVAGRLGEPASIEPPRGAATEFKYNRNLQQVEIKRSISVQQAAYDEQGRMIFQKEELGDGNQRETRLDIDVKGFVTRRRVSGVEVDGAETTIEYNYTPDDVSRVKVIEHPGGSKQSFDYNALGHLIKMSLETYVEEYKPDRHGNILEVTKGGDVVVSTDYDGLDRPTATRTLSGTQTYLTERTYFRGGELKSQKTTDPTFGVVEDRVIGQIDALGRALSTTVNGDTVSRNNSFTHDVGVRTATGPRQTVTERWDVAGYPTRQADSIVTTTLTTDGNGNVERMVREEDGASYADTFTYNDLDHRQTAADNFGPVATFVPRADGKNLELRNARNNTTRASYTALGELLTRRRADGMEFRFRHDAQRQMKYTGDPGKGFDYSYDNLFRLTRRTQRDGASIGYTGFDARNNPKSITLPGGTISLDYDLQKRPTRSTVSFGGTTYESSTEYDALSRPRVVNYQQSGGSANRAIYDHDKAGPLLSARFEEDGADFTVGYNYRNDLTRSRITYPSGYVVNEIRDNAGRLTGLQGTVEEIASVTEWQGNRQPRLINFGGIMRVDHRYDARGRLTGSRYARTPGGAMQAELRYQYDAADNVEMRQFLHRAGKTDNFSYDTGERLSRAQIGGIPLDGGTALSRLTYQRAYGYEATGLDYLLTAPVTAPAGSVLPPFAASWSGHDGFLLPATVNGVSRGQPDAMGRVGGAQLWTRAVGGAVPVPVSATLQHNGLGQLVRIERADGVLVENFFQPSGLRYARKTSQGGTVLDYRHFVYDNAGRLLEEFDRTGSEPVLIGRYFYMDGDAPCAADLPDGNGVLRRYYYIQDDQQSVVAVANRFGVVEERVWYDPFGQPTIEPRDTAAPVIKRIIGGAGGTLLIEMSEPVTAIVFDLGLQAGIRRLTQSYTDLVAQPAGRTDLPEVVPGYAPYSVIVFTPEQPMTNTVTLALRPGKLTDDWDNHVLEQGVTVTATNVAGTIYYAAAGNPVTDSGTVTRSTVGSPFLFHGQHFDYDTGLLYLRARFYDSFSGMFLEPDPMGYEDSVNMYAGLKNSPTNVRDPSGQVGERRRRSSGYGDTSRDWDRVVSGKGGGAVASRYLDHWSPKTSPTPNSSLAHPTHQNQHLNSVASRGTSSRPIHSAATHHGSEVEKLINQSSPIQGRNSLHKEMVDNIVDHLEARGTPNAILTARLIRSGAVDLKFKAIRDRGEYLPGSHEVAINASLANEARRSGNWHGVIGTVAHEVRHWRQSHDADLIAALGMRLTSQTKNHRRFEHDTATVQREVDEFSFFHGPTGGQYSDRELLSHIDYRYGATTTRDFNPSVVYRDLNP